MGYNQEFMSVFHVYICYFISGKSVGFCMLCELQRHVLRTFNHNQNEAIKPMAIIQKLKRK